MDEAELKVAGTSWAYYEKLFSLELEPWNIQL
jgi:hypothetical protein